jgi:uncharacterized protein
VRITLAELERHRIVISKTYACGSLSYHGADFRQVAPLKVDAVAELAAGSQVRIHGCVEARLETSCDRCLASVGIPVKQDFELFYRPVSTIAREEEVELPEDELGVGFFSGDGIELADVVTEQVILSVPMKVVCRTECRGICPVCKANLNFEKCSCLPTKGKSPFSILIEGRVGH